MWRVDEGRERTTFDAVFVGKAAKGALTAKVIDRPVVSLRVSFTATKARSSTAHTLAIERDLWHRMTSNVKVQ